ncbi:hypothetical protein Vadar_030052 [Vaccinium darrowii]|uniref:Uncharacterized protein n=1 Tax=Vaccinium darrowii TaxID=229202 RepID=A0ACB7Y407_9ERIC|nr:hypothetical protein Vadar_030052 [Vaccinium darrowii]
MCQREHSLHHLYNLHNLRNLQWIEWNRYLRVCWVVMNQQAQNQPPPPPVMGVPIAPEPPRAELISIKDFQKMKPPVFGGGIDPSRADDWELSMEKIFAVMTPAQCPETHKVVLATYNFEGEAHRWWLQQREREANMTWGRFLEVFHEKYYLQTIRIARLMSSAT